MRHTLGLPLLAFLLMLMAKAMAADEAEERAVAAIEKLGGRFEREQARPDMPVVSVNLAGRKVSDKDLEDLKDLPSLEALNLSSNQITDEGLKHLKGLKILRSLHLTFNFGVTDEGLEHLEGLSRLELLHVGYTFATSVGQAKLRKALPNLKIEGP